MSWLVNNFMKTMQVCKVRNNFTGLIGKIAPPSSIFCIKVTNNKIFPFIFSKVLFNSFAKSSTLSFKLLSEDGFL